MTKRIPAFMSLIPLAAAAWALEGAPGSPLAALRARDRQLRDVLGERKREATPANEARLRQAVNGTFDYAAHARSSFGRYWEQLSEAERREALRLVSTLLERAALDKVTEFSLDRIQYVSESVDPGGEAATVLTRVRRGAETAEIGYRMVRAGEAWRIVDIVVEGSSSVESNRAAFAKEIRASGVPGLLEKLRRKAERSVP
jgi:phospholipid transport system substrate-binding protein